MVQAELLRNSTLAEGLSDDQLAVLAEFGKTHTFQPGDPILGLEDIDYRLLVLLSGEVKICGVMGDEVGLVRPGNLLGEISFLDHQPRSATSIASTEVVIAEFGADLLFRLTERDPLLEAQVLYNVALVVCKKLRFATKQIDAGIV